MGLYRWQGIKVSRTWANIAFVLFPLFWVINFLMAARVFDAIATAKRPYTLNKWKLLQEKKRLRSVKAEPKTLQLQELSAYQIPLWHMHLLG